MPDNLLRPLSVFLQGAPLVFAHEFHKPPYGGVNQFLAALKANFELRGNDVAWNRITKRSRALLFNSFSCDFDYLRKRRRPNLRYVHRVDGPVGAYRGKEEGLDRLICEMNREMADATVFQSRYCLEEHRKMGLEFRNSRIIVNASDPTIFYPPRKKPSIQDSDKVRIVTSSWSDNPRKGQAVYEWLDRNLDFRRYDYTFIGRCKASFTNIRMIPPANSHELADILRQQHIFLIASQNEPCSNALIEALSCGLPVAYLRSGSHAEIAGHGGMGFDSAEEIPAILECISANYESFCGAIKAPDIADVADQYLKVLTDGIS
jgi:glycosyltransferase involved in cell wall biosynthesis